MGLSLLSFMSRIARFRSWVVLVVLVSLLLQPSWAQICTFWDMGCVDPLAQTAVTVDLPPLFLDELEFYYGFDSNSNGKGRGPVTKASFWLAYDAPRINSTVINLNRTSEVALRVGNLTGTPGGRNNGCDNIWGYKCSRNLKDLLTGAIFNLATSGSYYANPLDTVLHQLLAQPPILENCPFTLFEVQDILVASFAQESVIEQTATVQTPGSNINPWKNFVIDGMAGSEMAEQVAVAIFSRAPSYDSGPPRGQDDIQIELVCVQAPSKPNSSSQGPDSDDESD